MKKRLFCVAAILIAICTALSACDPLPSETDNSQLQTINPNSRTTEVERRDLVYETVISAVMTPVHVTNLYFKDVSGPLLTKNVQIYDRIVAGQVLAELDPFELEKDIERAELRKQVYELQRESNAISLKNHDILIAQYLSVLNDAKAVYQEDKSDVNKRRMDSAQLTYNLSVNNKKLAEVTKLVADLDYEDFMITYERTVARLENRVMTASEGGVITSIDSSEIGETIPAGRYLYKYVKWSDMVFKITGIQASNLIGQENISLTVNKETYSARSYIPVPGDDIFFFKDIGSKTLAYLAFNGKTPDVEMQEPHTLTLRIEKSGTLCVSKKCIRTSGGLTFVSLKVDGSFVDTPVVCGIETSEYVEILSGISEGDEIALDIY